MGYTLSYYFWMSNSLQALQFLLWSWERPTADLTLWLCPILDLDRVFLIFRLVRSFIAGKVYVASIYEYLLSDFASDFWSWFSYAIV